MTDQDSDIPISYDFHRGEINDECSIPLVGIYTLRIKNANVFKMMLTLKKRFSRRSLIEIVRKQEMLRYKMNQAETKDDKESKEYYETCINVLDWVREFGN